MFKKDILQTVIMYTQLAIKLIYQLHLLKLGIKELNSELDYSAFFKFEASIDSLFRNNIIDIKQLLLHKMALQLFLA
jgi:hypothetical protein